MVEVPCKETLVYTSSQHKESSTVNTVEEEITNDPHHMKSKKYKSAYPFSRDEPPIAYR